MKHYDAYFDIYEPDFTTDTISLREIGGVGQMMYPYVRFKDYDWDYENDVLVAYPTLAPTQENYEACQDISGNDLLAKLCNLAKSIDDPENHRPYTEEILEWCKKYVHPYTVDGLVELVKDPQFETGEVDFLIKKSATFSIDQFMHDLGNLYFAVRFSNALEAVCMGYDDKVPEICKGGRFFEDIPFFEKFRSDPDQRSAADYSSAKGDLIEEMKLDAAVPDAPSPAEFVRTPYDEYEELREKLMDLIPTFSIKPRINPRRPGRYIFAAEVHSIFDVCWYTFARMLIDDAPSDLPALHDEYDEELTPKQALHKAPLYNCLYCGEYFYRKRAEQLYCMKPDCQHARKAKNQRDFRSRTRMKKANEK